MQQLGDIIRQRRKELGLTLERLASAVGCHKSYLSQIENGRRPPGSAPSDDLLAKLERSLRLPPQSLRRLATWASLPGAVRQDLARAEMNRQAGRRLAALLRERSLDSLHASGELEALVRQLASAEAEPGRASHAATPGRRSGREIELIGLPVQVPVINRVNAGYPREFTDMGYPARVADEYVSVPEVHDPDAFAARVVGDSMLPDYREGDIVVFSPERPLRSGMDCFVRFERDAETTFKRVYFERDAHPHAHEPPPAGEPDRIRLQPLNPAYPPRVIAREDVAGLYPAVWVVRHAPAGSSP